MSFYNLECEVPGGVGPETIYDKNVTPWVIKNLHLVLDGWLGGEILAVSSCLIVSEKLKNFLSFDFTGILKYEHFQLEESENLRELQPDIELPKFSRMIVGSSAFEDDFALVKYNDMYNQLIISDKAKEALEKFNLGNYSIEPAMESV